MVLSAFVNVCQNQTVWTKISGVVKNTLSFNNWQDGNLAAKCGHVEILKNKKKGLKISSESWQNASETGQLSVLEFLHEVGFDGYTRHVADTAAKNGQLKVIEWLHLNRTEGCTTNAMDTSSENGHLHVTEWLHNNRFEGCSVRAMEAACQNGHLRTVEWLQNNRKEGCSQNVLDLACMNGHLDVADWLVKQKEFFPTVQTILLTTRHGQFHILRWIANLIHTPFHELHCILNDLIHICAENGRTDILGYIVSSVPQTFPWNQILPHRGIDLAAENGHLSIVKWIHENFPRAGCSTSAMDGAAKNGHMHVLEWLYAHRYEGCTDQAFCNAASQGHLHVLEWLCESFNPMSLENLGTEVISNGHLHVVEWLVRSNHQCPCLWRIDIAARDGQNDIFRFLFKLNYFKIPKFSKIVKALSNAAQNNHLAIIEWVYEEMKLRYTDDQWVGSPWHSQLYKILIFALEAGNMDVVKEVGKNFQFPLELPVLSLYPAAARGQLAVFAWIERKSGLSCLPANLIDQAAAGGHLKLCQLLVAVYKERKELSACTKAAMDHAAENGHLRTVEWLHYERSEGCTHLAMDGAATNSHLRVLKWLCQHRPEGCSVGALKSACRNGDLQIVTFLLDHAVSPNRMEFSQAMHMCVEGGHFNVFQLLWQRNIGECSPTVIQAIIDSGQTVFVDFAKCKAPTTFSMVQATRPQHPKPPRTRLRRSKSMFNLANCF